MSVTVDYSPELFSKVMENMADYHQTGETVCGAEDPAVIELWKPIPEFPDFLMVRVTERYVNPWKSETRLYFSNDELSELEQELADELLDERLEG